MPLGSIDLEIYVAGPYHLDREQYIDSQILLALIKGDRIEKSVRIIELATLDTNKEFFEVIKERKTALKLPFMVQINNDEIGIILGGSGIDGVLEALSNIDRVGLTEYDTLSGRVIYHGMPKSEH